MRRTALLLGVEQRDLPDFAAATRARGLDPLAVDSDDALRRAGAERELGLVIVDLDGPHGQPLLTAVDLPERTPLICLTSSPTLPVDLPDGALRLSKPCDAASLAALLDRADTALDPAPATVPTGLIGESPEMREVFGVLERVAATDSTVLLVGETGTGKDRLAEALHAAGPRRDGPFVAINCGALAPNLIESELFGHEPGSFTGARKQRHGVFEQAAGGTLYLDEITEMSTELQIKLLRVLESRTLQRVGGERTIEIDVRLVAATNRAPEAAVAEEQLREDLFYRLAVFPIHVPPLRERTGDVVRLARHFLDELNRANEASKRLSPAAEAALDAHHWPGNVRELRNVVERAFILAPDTLEAEHVQLDAQALTGERPDDRDAEQDVEVEVGMSIDEAEKALILATLESLDGDKRRCAEILGISLKTLYNRLNRYGLGRSRASQS